MTTTPKTAEITDVQSAESIYISADVIELNFWITVTQICSAFLIVIKFRNRGYQWPFLSQFELVSLNGTVVRKSL